MRGSFAWSCKRGEKTITTRENEKKMRRLVRSAAILTMIFFFFFFAFERPLNELFFSPLFSLHSGDDEIGHHSKQRPASPP